MGYADRQRERFKSARNATRTESGGRWFRIQDGENLLRILGFKHEVTAGDFKLGRYDKKDYEIGEEIEEIYCPYRMHFRPKPGPCGILTRMIDGNEIGDCEACEDQNEMARSRGKSDQEAARKHKVNQKYAMLVVNLEPKDGVKKIQVWEAPGTIVDYVIDCMNSRKYKNKKLWGPEGLDLLIQYNSKAKSPRDYYHMMEFMDESDSDKLDLSDIDGEVMDLFSVLRYVPVDFQRHIENPVDEEAGSGKKSEEHSRKKPTSRGRPKKEEPEEDDTTKEEGVEEEPSHEEAVDYEEMDVTELREVVVEKGLAKAKDIARKRKSTLLIMLQDAEGGGEEEKKADEDDAFAVGTEVIVTDGKKKLKGEVSGEAFEDDGKTWVPVIIDGEEFDTEIHELEVA